MKFFLCSIVIVFAMTGCGEPSQSKIIGASEQENDGVVQQGVENAVYLPGGGALQFSSKAKSDEVKLDSRGVKHKSVIFEFSDPVADVYSAVDGILKDQGYSVSVLSNSRYKYFARYQKDGKSVIVGFRETVSEGFSRVSSVVFWWPI